VIAFRSPVFLDASGWIAILNADDGYHSRATEVVNELVTTLVPLVTTDWVLAEVGNSLARTRLRTEFVAGVGSFSSSEYGRVIRIDHDIFRRALELYKAVADKTWGLVDCASFVVMQNEGMREALTADHHFEQAGFTCLLPTD
jgi:uncharacterized protein